jgi:hypothetical protein
MKPSNFLNENKKNLKMGKNINGNQTNPNASTPKSNHQ